jgi:hypothetical protein
MNAYKIVELKREDWEGYPLKYSYTAHNYWAVEIKRSGNNFNVALVKKAFPSPVVKSSHRADKLFQHWLQDVKAHGIVENGKLLAVVESSAEWSNRLCVSQIWVHFTTFHYTYRHFTPSHLHFTTFSFGLTNLHIPTTLFHLTSLN